MKRLWFLICVLALAPAAWAFQDAADNPKTPAEQLKALQAEFSKARADIVTKYRAATDEAEKEELLDQYYAVPQSFIGKFADFAEKHAKEPQAVQALAWLAGNGGASPQAEKAAETLVKDHLSNPQIAMLLQQAQRSPSPVLEKIVRGVMEKSTDKNRQGQATFALAKLLGTRVELIQSLKKAEADDLKRSQAMYGKELVAKLKDADPEQVCKEAEALLDQVVKKFSDVKEGRSTLGETAKTALFEMRNLAIGKVAPEIVGEDTDGKPIKLSDYRGKVVVLDFWGHW